MLHPTDISQWVLCVPLLVDLINGMLDGTRPAATAFEQVGSDVVVTCSPSGAFVDGAATY